MRTFALDQENSIAVDALHARRTAALAGARAIAPLTVGLVPLALTVGTAAAHAGLPPLVGWMSSAFLYGGSGQLTWIQLAGSGAPVAIVVGTTLMVNLQLLIYGATMRTYWAVESRRWRLVAAHLLVSPVLGVAAAHHQTEADPRLRKTYYMTCGITLWSAWLLLTGIGYASGGLPSWPVVTVLTPLVMVSLALRGVRDAGTATALVVAVAAAIVASDVPYDLGLLAAGAAGAVAGVLEEHLVRSRRRQVIA